MASRTLIFSSGNLRAYFVPAEEGRRSRELVVTFFSMIDLRATYETGQSEATIQRAGFDAIHVIPRNNAWYQYESMPDLLETLRRIGANYEATVTYGLSMGGFAALHATRALNARRSVAYAPQFSVDRRKIGYVHQSWANWVRNHRFIWDRAEDVSRDCTHIVVFDPLSLDDEHVRAYEAHVPVERMVMPFAGHHVWRELGHAGIGDKALIHLLKGDLDFSWIRQAVRRKRRQNARYFVNMGKRFPRATNALQIALSIDPIDGLAAVEREDLLFIDQTRPDFFQTAADAVRRLEAQGNAKKAEAGRAQLRRLGKSELMG